MRLSLTACFLVFAALESASVHGQSLGSQKPPSDSTSLSQPQPQESGVTVEPQLRADIDRMIEVAHLRERIIEISRLRFEQVRPQLTASMPPPPNRGKILLEYAEKYTSLHSTSDYMNKVAGVYAKYFSDEDIKGMIQFYQTSAGQHYIAKIPQVTADMAQVAESAAAEGIPHIWKQLCGEYPELRGKLKYCIEPDTEGKSLLTNPTVDPKGSQLARMLR